MKVKIKYLNLVKLNEDNNYILVKPKLDFSNSGYLLKYVDVDNKKQSYYIDQIDEAYDFKKLFDFQIPKKIDEDNLNIYKKFAIKAINNNEEKYKLVKEKAKIK